MAVGALSAFSPRRSHGQAAAGQPADPTVSAVRVAVDQDLADWDTPLAGAREIAFFPPMTGG